MCCKVESIDCMALILGDRRLRFLAGPCFERD